MISGSDWRAAVEADTRLTDIQALTRRLELKLRDGGVERLILVLADTRTNRAGLLALKGSFPVPQAVILVALREGTQPPGSGIVLV